MTMQTSQMTVSLGELIAVLFDAYMDEFNDEELAAAAAAASLNRWLEESDEPWVHAA